MGHSSYSNDAAKRLYDDRASKSVNDVFVNTAKGIFDSSLNPKGVKMRESRDSDAHPESNAIAIFFDETGSMGGIPKMFAFEKLPSLMRLLTTKGYVAHPQVLFGAIGDARNKETAPLQVGQFESGLEMDDCLTKIYLEGNGGGQNRESYDLALYFAARHMAMDCLEKRGKKGYLFIIGDEECFEMVSKVDVEHYIGDKLQANIPLKTIVEEAQAKFEVFRICVPTGSYRDGSLAHWQNLLGERALLLDHPDHVCELIGTTIGACEGRDLDDIHSDLIAGGSTKAAADAAKKAMVPFAKIASEMAKAGTVTGALAPTGTPLHKSKRL